MQFFSDLVSFAVVFVGFATAISNDAPSITPRSDGGIVRSIASNGDQVPDYSYCGYEASESPIPTVADEILVQPSGGDDTSRIQAAIDSLVERGSSPQFNAKKGWCGAVLLGPGVFTISGTIRLHGHHVVLRGTFGNSGPETEIRRTGTSRRPAIVVGSESHQTKLAVASGSPNSELPGSIEIVEYVPIGARKIRLKDANHLQVGQSVTIVHSSTNEWIRAVRMHSFPNDDGKGSWLDWKPYTVDQSWNRTIIEINENNIVLLDAPITSSIDPALTKGFVTKSLPNEHHHLGIENLRIVSEVDRTQNPMNEEHAWDGVRFANVTDAWASDLRFSQFAGSAVLVSQSARRVTVRDCFSERPVSELAGWRRHTFFCMGQQVLFLRCQSEDGRHDFVTGPLTSGPNAFVYCLARNANGFSGPLGSWSTGVLFDNVEIDGNSLELSDHGTEMAGTGWASVNSVLWNCVAAKVVCRRPPTGFNLACGVWGEVSGDGDWKNLSEFISPDSLFNALLSERLGETHCKLITSKQKYAPKPDPSAIRESRDSFPPNDTSKQQTSAKQARIELGIKNGWLTLGDRLATGKRQTLSWWRGSLLPARAMEFGSGLTRFVPGLVGPLYTNSIEELVDQMEENNAVVLEHHWGLWYDRRRDDHLMVRRMDSEATPPFYEQPWARSGQGRAWDGLSKYDLTEFNPWYFERLAQFASVADQKGLVLMQYMYFQHNLLESGAHWADFPWRTANCVQDVGFEEPPPYENRKRILMAEAFYDVSNPVRRELHKKYIRHCLDTLGDYSNVLFVLGEEYSGPAHFMKFWLDTIRDWSGEKNRDVKIMLSACRNVQEEVLSSPEYSKLVDVVDVKYWWITSTGQLYEPAGGKNLAPRQQLRNWTGPKSSTSESLSLSIRDLKSRFPDKAVICSRPCEDVWMLLAAGCSLVDLPRTTEPTTLRSFIDLSPVHHGTTWELRPKNGSPIDSSSQANARLVVIPKGVLNSDLDTTSFQRIDPRTGKLDVEMTTDPKDSLNLGTQVFWGISPN